MMNSEIQEPLPRIPQEELEEIIRENPETLEKHYTSLPIEMQDVYNRAQYIAKEKMCNYFVNGMVCLKNR